MIIERVQVDGGFLDNLDLHLTPGLNVIIGGRGTGKTSIIELIRYCLGIAANTNVSSKLALEHALSTIGDGRVSVTLNDGQGQIVVSRSALDDDMIEVELTDLPIVYSQTEIESVGLSARARIRLLDSFDLISDNYFINDFITSELSSTTVEMSTVAQEIDILQNALKTESTLLAELKDLEIQEKQISDISVDIGSKQAELVTLSREIAEMQLLSNSLTRSAKTLDPWAKQIEILSRIEPDIGQWKEYTLLNTKLQPIKNSIVKIKELMAEAMAILSEAQNVIAAENDKITFNKINPENRIRQLRKEIDNLQEGAGAVLNKVNLLRQKLAELDNIKTLKSNLSLKYSKLHKTRSTLLNDFEESFNQRFIRRSAIANQLNLVLSPQIKITLKQAAEYSDYINAIVSALRGSNLKYNELAPLLANSLSPRELVEAVESNDVDFIQNATGFTKDRVLRLISQLKPSDLQNILSVHIEDDVVLQLLDGKDYKEVQHLSVGQRCTVILPIILEHLNRTLIVDQPEDHLDNAFIVHTLIKSIRKKQQSTQLLFSTHNANIPVLGEAENVIVMKSNGQRGYVSNTGRLDHPEIVDAITTIMEGGRDAFERRADFYHEHQ